MVSDSLIEQLADSSLPFARKLQLAVIAELDYWETRNDPPNLSRTEFKKLVNHIPLGLVPEWRPRDSFSGPHGQTGETNVFKFEFDVTILGKRMRFFLKGYFFDADKCRGVTIQSFRKVKTPQLKSVF